MTEDYSKKVSLFNSGSAVHLDDDEAFIFGGDFHGEPLSKFLISLHSKVTQEVALEFKLDAQAANVSRLENNHKILYEVFSLNFLGRDYLVLAHNKRACFDDENHNQLREDFMCFLKTEHKKALILN